MDTTPNVATAATPADTAPAPEIVDPNAPPTPEGEKPPESAPPKRVSRVQTRIDQLTAEKYEEQRAREAAESRLAQIERQAQLSQQYSQIQQGAPRVEQFATLQEYMNAHATYSAQMAALQATAQWEQRQAQEQQRQAQFQAHAMAQQQQVMRENVHIEEKMAAGTKKYADFQQVVMNPELPPIRSNPALLQALISADNAADIAYYTAKNPAEYERLLSIRDPIQVAREVLKLDAKFSGNGPHSGAPPPPPSRNGSAATSKDWTQMSTAEHVKAYQAQRHPKR